MHLRIGIRNIEYQYHSANRENGSVASGGFLDVVKGFYQEIRLWIYDCNLLRGICIAMDCHALVDFFQR